MAKKKPSKKKAIKNQEILKVHYINIGQISPSSWNPRTVTDAEFLALKNSLEKYGLQEPLIINQTTGNLLSGHQRYRAMKELGHKKVPVSFVEMSEKQEKAFAIVLNSHAAQGKFELESLSSLLEEIKLDMPEDFFELRFDALEKDLGLAFKEDGEIKEKEIDETISTEQECPSCGYKY